jgi:hypothetical protein
MNTLCEINAFLDDGKEIKPFYLKIIGPILDDKGGDYYCAIHSPSILKEDKNIYGVDKKQAQVLAFSFIQKLLSNRKVIDKEGNPIFLS